MKSFKKYVISEAEMTDADLAVYPSKVKLDKNGNVSSYKLEMYIEDGKTKQRIKDSGLEKAIVSFIGVDDLKSSIAINTKGMIIALEIYEGTSGKYIELGSRKVYFKA